MATTGTGLGSAPLQKSGALDLSLYKHVDIKKVGKPPSFKSPQEMWERAVKYFEWCEANPIDETKLFNSQGLVINGKVPHMRAMTQAGLCIHLGISVSSWHDYKKKDKYLEVTRVIEQVMTEQKFTGAASGMLKENIIARDLGIGEPQQEQAAQPLTINFSVDDARKDAKS